MLYRQRKTMRLVLSIVTMLGIPPLRAAPYSALFKGHEETACPKKVVRNKQFSLQELRLEAEKHKFFNPDQPYIKRDPNMQAIVGGTRAMNNDYPWLALLLVQDSSMNIVQRCTGIAINQEFMLTVAHCTPESEDGSLTVLMGFNEIKYAGVHSQYVTLVHKSEIYIPRDYTRHGYVTSHDIAIFRYNVHGQAIKSLEDNFFLPLNKYPNLLKYATNCSVVGYGLVSYDHWTQARYLQIGTVSILEEIHQTIRFGTRYRGGPCAGDDGAPLLCMYKNRLSLFGLVVGNVYRPLARQNCDLSEPMDALGQAVKINRHYWWITRVMTFIHYKIPLPWWGPY